MSASAFESYPCINISNADTGSGDVLMISEGAAGSDTVYTLREGMFQGARCHHGFFLT